MSVSMKWIYVIIVSLVLLLPPFFTSCSCISSIRKSEINRLPLGLYEVVDCNCSYSQDAPEDCSKTQYLELVTGVFRSLDKDEVAFVTWLSDDPNQEHTFIMRDLKHGRFINAHEYIIEDDSFGKEWFVVSGDRITDYFFTRYSRRTPFGDMAGETHLVLRRINRSNKIDRLLPYPPVTN